MKNKFKRVTAFLLGAFLFFGSFATIGVRVNAEENSNVQKGEFIYAPHTYLDGDLTDIYYYSDDFFAGSAFEYNEHLATMSMIMAAASISSQEPGVSYEEKSQNLEKLFRDLDFTHFETNEYYTEKPSEQTMGVAMAIKHIGEGDDAYTLLAIIPRSAGYEKEWAGNFTVGDGVTDETRLHQGFLTGRDIVLDFVKQYVYNNHASFDQRVKVWTVGYSRGAGVANLLGAYINENLDFLSITGHDLEEQLQFNESSHWQVCSICGEMKAIETHSYDENNVCTVCGYEKVEVEDETEEGDEELDVEPYELGEEDEEDDFEAINITVKQEDVFVYTFGTPSTVEYKTEEEKAKLESDHLNIFNRYSEYDIVTYAPFTNWNFAHYGVTKLFDVHNAEKKAEMLTYLEKTNKTIYDLYVAENSSADPDNFTALMLSVSEDGSVSFVPAKAEYNIPSTQKAFLDERVAFVTQNLVPSRQIYVEAGYEYALQRLTSLFFGINATQQGELIAGMSHDVKILAGAYYAFFISDYYLDDVDHCLTTAKALADALPIIEGYIKANEEDESVASQSWYVYAKNFIESEEYLNAKTLLNAAISSELAFEVLYEEYFSTVQDVLEMFAVGITQKVFAAGVSAITMENQEEKAQLLETMTSLEFAQPITRFFAYLLLGCELDEDEEINVFDPSNKAIANAVTFVANAGRYMRSHNNEIILSWLRTEDSYYSEKDWHVHSYEAGYDKTHHWNQCECNEIEEKYEHEFDQWFAIGDPENGMQTYKRNCICGYYETKQEKIVLPKEPLSTGAIAAICVGSVLVLAGIAGVIVINKKGKIVK